MGKKYRKPAKRVTEEEQVRLRELLDELLEVDEGLSDFAVNFIESLSKWDGLFTAKQGIKLDEIYEQWSDKDA